MSVSPTSPADVPMQGEPDGSAAQVQAESQAPAPDSPTRSRAEARASPSGVEELSRAFASNLHMGSRGDLPSGAHRDLRTEGRGQPAN